MAGLGSKLFTDGSTLDAAQVNGYLMDQTIMRFATTAARDAAFGGVGEASLTEGMCCYVDADNTIFTYDGSNWVKMVSASNPVGLEYIGSWSATSGTSLRLTDCFSPEYNNYQLNITGYTNATTGAGLQILFGGNATNYKLGGTYVPTLTANAIGRYGSGITTTTAGALGFLGGGSRVAGKVDIFDASIAQFTHYIASSSHTVSDNAFGPSWIAGWHIVGTAWTFADIQVTSGAFQNIECRMYGYRN